MSGHEHPDPVRQAIERHRALGEPMVVTKTDIARGLPAKTFWGRAWCENLERYSDYEGRLPRGRSYLRRDSVYDLTIEPGHIFAYVAGENLYEVEISVVTLARQRWDVLKRDVAGEVGNLVDLLSGQLGEGVMAAVTDPDVGLFPSPAEITLNCSCPDHADCCKHVAAAIYAVGVEFDARPELLFTLRKVDPSELIEAAGDGAMAVSPEDPSAGVLSPGELGDLFGIDLGDPEDAFG